VKRFYNEKSEGCGLLVLFADKNFHGAFDGVEKFADQ
jgi:hypothetical protein